MYNDFLIVGPAADPAGVKGLTDAAAALRQIADRQALFISRGDDSGTHLREQALWAAAGLEPAGDWYRSVGQGMGATLTLADQADAYTLTDRGTFLSRGAQGLGLVRLVEGDGRLINLYSVILVNPARHPGVRAELAEAFAAWLTEPQTQAAIAAYRIQDQLLFAPNADSRCPPQCDVVDASYTPPPPPPFGLRAVLREAVRLILSADPVLWQIVRLSLWVSGIAVLLAAVLGIPAGAWLGLRHFPGSSWLTVFIYTGMGFPPVVVGLFVYLLLSRQGPLTGLDWLFTPSAMIMAQTILAVPLVLGVTMSSVRGVPEELRRQLRSLGATEWQVVWAVLAEARFGVIVGLVAGFGAAISEVGAVMLVGGNIHGQTRVLTTAILLETRRGNFDLALALGIILLGLAFLANLVAVRLQRD